MRATQLERREVEFKGGLQFLSIPMISADKLFVVVAFLVPTCEERTAEVKPLTVPALRYHVELPSDLLLVDLFGLVRIRHVEHAALAVAEATHEERSVVRAQADVHGQ